CLAGAVFLPAWALWRTRQSTAACQFSWSLAFMPLAVITPLVLMVFMHSHGYLADPRYYVAAGPSAVLVIYGVVTLQPMNRALSVLLALMVGLAFAHDVLYR